MTLTCGLTVTGTGASSFSVGRLYGTRCGLKFMKLHIKFLLTN
jgi:hypothetical protein